MCFGIETISLALQFERIILTLWVNASDNILMLWVNASELESTI